jgi:hypothetical protein
MKINRENCNLSAPAVRQNRRGSPAHGLRHEIFDFVHAGEQERPSGTATIPVL